MDKTKNQDRRPLSELSDKKLAVILLDSIFEHSDFVARTVYSEHLKREKAITDIEREHGEITPELCKTVLNNKEKIREFLKVYGKKHRPEWLTSFVDAVALGDVKLKGGTPRPEWAKNVDVTGIYIELIKNIGLKSEVMVLKLMAERLNIPGYDNEKATNLSHTSGSETLGKFIKAEIKEKGLIIK